MGASPPNSTGLAVSDHHTAGKMSIPSFPEAYIAWNSGGGFEAPEQSFASSAD